MTCVINTQGNQNKDIGKEVKDMSKRYFACVYGGANERIASQHKEKIEELGRLIATNGFSLVYGAGATGCMGAVARGVKE